MTSTARSLAPQYSIIEVTHSGDVTSADFRNLGREVKALMDSTGIDRVLADWTEATSAPDNIALVGYGETLTQAGLPADFRHAHVWPKDAHTRMSLDMWKTVEMNQGHAARVFGDRESAIEWLSA